MALLALLAGAGILALIGVVSVIIKPLSMLAGLISGLYLFQILQKNFRIPGLDENESKALNLVAAAVTGLVVYKVAGLVLLGGGILVVLVVSLILLIGGLPLLNSIFREVVQ